MTSKFSIDNRELLQRISSGEAVVGIDFGNLIVRELAAFRLAAMDSESGYLPLDYLQGHKDGLEWAAQLAEANHPETGDWLYDDPIELAKAIRKGPDMQPAQPVEDSEPDRNPVLAYADSYRDMAKQGVESVPIWSVITDIERNIAPLYRHAQPALVIPDEMTAEQAYEIGYYYGDPVNVFARGANWMRQHIIDSTLAAAQHDTPALNSVQSVVTVPGKWIPVSERMPEVGVKVLCFPAEDEPIHAVFNGQLWLQDVSWSSSEEPIDNVIPVTVTHWMPLPAGPQEVR
ncbi:TPA: DUF551 domain-containing protein [Escherichia coli]|uniref:DUF551 domain-containing protein n=1 Tax=Klebsiella pneumoniae TaxID=573 RepID=UPI000E2D609F|nr:DUF551 domain-containing protein [Klebsiella pneumoniae]HCN2318413.1 DUF551 domain-containing protein [Escherichia coli]SWY60448.1 Eaa1 [Klebsiella pneumoniae]HBT5799379.1 DUF551 domain-containing protein [Klebsiella pneumoniae]HCN3630537.1 DUF551 domain-containing protein [Escherichia coli]HDG8009717.1 DUF551 domain-containing protein [Klebsiella pneumoniae]